MSRSGASTFCTLSLNVTMRLVSVLETVAPAAGIWVKTVGAMTLVGGMVIVATTTGEVPRTPLASEATAVRRLVPNGATHSAEYGAVLSLPKETPLLKNSTWGTPVMALAVAVTSQLVGPCVTKPFAGLVMAATGVPARSYTTTGFSVEVVVAPWSSVAMAVRRCAAREGLFQTPV